MNTSAMTVGRRLAWGFGLVFFLMAALCTLAITRVTAMDENLDKRGQ
jgi:hypothetical protein